MVINPDPIKTLVDNHIGLIDNMYLLRTTIDHLLETFSPHLVEGLKRESMSFLKSMDQHIRCEEEALFPVLRSSLGSKSAPIISMSGEHANLKRVWRDSELSLQTWRLRIQRNAGRRFT